MSYRKLPGIVGHSLRERRPTSRLLAAISLLSLHLGCGEDARLSDARVAWSVTMSGAGSHKVESIAADAHDNVVAAGTFSGELELPKGNVTAESDDVFIGKWDRDGQPVWLRTFGSADLDQAHAVALDAAGNAYVAGTFTQSIDFGSGPLSATALQTIFLAKFDAGGDVTWARSLGSDGFQSACCVKVLPSGNVVLAGDFTTTLNLTGEDFVSAGSSDVFVATFDADGQPLVSRSFGDAAGQRVTALEADADDQVALLGAFQGELDFGGDVLLGGAETHEALFLAKLDSQLDHIWSRNALPADPHAAHGHGHGSGHSERAHAVAIDDASNVLVQAARSVGQSTNGQDFEAPADPHAIVMQYDRRGAESLSRAVGSTPLGTQDEGAVAIDELGHRWLALSFRDHVDVDGEGALESSGGRDIALIELDARSQLRRSWRYGEASRSEVAWSAVAGRGTVTVGGWSRRLDEFGREEGLILQFDVQTE